MSFPYTPAQIAAFRSAFETIVEGIEQGEKAKNDEQFISLMRGVEGSGLVAESPKSSQVESHHSKDVFSVLPWFGKRKNRKTFNNRYNECRKLFGTGKSKSCR
ncbi:MAG: hypothetical protein IPN42_05085 [Methylococcaceae bacterium]|nr:hypothetical protein [Methylococcaceae bacterium]